MKSIHELANKTSAKDPLTGHVQHGDYTVTGLIGSVRCQPNMEVSLVSARRDWLGDAEPEQLVLLVVTNNRTNVEVAIPADSFKHLNKLYAKHISAKPRTRKHKTT